MKHDNAVSFKRRTCNRNLTALAILRVRSVVTMTDLLKVAVGLKACGRISRSRQDTERFLNEPQFQDYVKVVTTWERSVRGSTKMVVASLEHVKIFAARSRQYRCVGSVVLLESIQVVRGEAASHPSTVVDFSAYKTRFPGISSGIILKTGHDQFQRASVPQHLHSVTSRQRRACILRITFRCSILVLTCLGVQQHLYHLFR